MNNSIVNQSKIISTFLLSLILFSCSTLETSKKDDLDEPSTAKEEEKELGFNPQMAAFFFTQHPIIKEGLGEYASKIELDSIRVDTSSQSIRIYYDKDLSRMVYREFIIDDFEEVYASLLLERLQHYDIQLFSEGLPLEEYVPNAVRDNIKKDKSRYDQFGPRGKHLVRRERPGFDIEYGLQNRYIAVWPSHGWYYNEDEDRWKWQRARFFGTVEDILTSSIVLNYLTPMLEDAGAHVLLPRERDLQTNEVIVDREFKTARSSYVEKGTWTSSEKGTGFKMTEPVLQDEENPFKSGSYRKMKTDLKGSYQAGWIPDIPEDGEYAVYVSYFSDSTSTENAKYTVYHSGGETVFYLNQKMGGSTWIYLDTFHFKKGKRPNSQKVVLSSQSLKAGELLTADAVRFGGGMGLVERGGRTSGKPKYLEAARYWMQYAGFPAESVYKTSDENDYVDDFRGRGEWVNYLMGKPNGPHFNKSIKGMNIPVDISFALHTDAGVSNDGSTVGSLMIYSDIDVDKEKEFPDGRSKMANRDLADLILSEVVDDIRLQFEPNWTERELRNADYSEATRPNTASALFELLSHQNFEDMIRAHDPEFKFVVARAIYKAITRFIADQEGYQPIFQPLAVSHMAANFDDQGDIKITWEPVLDSQEKSSRPDGYVIYTRINDNGFDNGVFVDNPEYVFEKPKKGQIYSFKVKALNLGGYSMPSEIISVGRGERGKATALIVNGFTRLSGPSIVNSQNFKGFSFSDDRGVAKNRNISFVGDQFNFDSTQPWVSDDEPGHGASYATNEGKVFAGNTFDYSYIHGKSILNTGYSFTSSSLDAVMDNHITLTDFKYVDLILGEQKTMYKMKDSVIISKYNTFPPKLQSKLKYYANSGGNIFVSGAYVSTDTFRNPVPDTLKKELLESILHIKHGSDHAVTDGEVKAIENEIIALPSNFKFNTELSKDIYEVESPDSIQPISDNTSIIARYSQNGFSAATAFEGYYKTVVFGFPFETILEESVRDSIMKEILTFFDETIR